MADRPVVQRGPFPFPKEAHNSFERTTSVGLTGVAAIAAIGVFYALTGVVGTGSVGTLAPEFAIDVVRGVQGTGSVGTFAVDASASEVPRPQVLTGPFPFPKETPDRFVIIDPNRTIPLTGGVEGSGSVGSLTVFQEPIFVDRPHRIDGPFPFLPGGFQQFIERIREFAPNPPQTATGVQATGSLGTLRPVFLIQPTGVSATSGLGSLVESVAIALTGVDSTSAVGSLTLSIDIPLIGVQATGEVGTFSTGNDGAAGLTGVEGIAAIGSISPVVGSPAEATQIITWNTESRTVTTWGPNNTIITWNTEGLTILTWNPS